MNSPKANAQSKTFVILCLILTLTLMRVTLNPEVSASEGPYPSKPIKITVTTTPGSGQDLFARKIAQLGQSPKYLGKPLAILNVPGGGGIIAVNKAFQDPADGYHLIAHSNSLPIKIASKELPMGVSGFDYICKMIHDPFVIAVRDDSPFRKIGDLIKAAHERPGKLKMAGGLVKAVQHTAALSFLSQAKVDIIWVPYEGQNDVLIALLGGHADMMHGNPSVILPHVKAGKLRVLATSNPERLSLFPDVVTYKELGIKPVIEGIWRGLVAKRGLPKEALDRLIAAFGQMTKDPEFVKFVESSNAEVIFVAGKNFEEEVRQEVETYR